MPPYPGFTQFNKPYNQVTQRGGKEMKALGHVIDRVFAVTLLNPSVVLATVPNRRVGSGSGSDPVPNRCNGSYHTKTRTVAIGPVLPPKTRHNKSTIFAPIKYLSSDRIVT